MAKEATYLARSGWLCAIVALGIPGPLTNGADLPDSEINRRTGFVETVEAFWSGSSFDIRQIVEELVLRRDAALSSWSVEITIRSATVSSRRPGVTYETDEPRATGIELGRVVDDFDPLGW